MEAVDLQAEHSLLQRIKLEAANCLFLRMKCEAAISKDFHCFACTLLKETLNESMTTAKQIPHVKMNLTHDGINYLQTSLED